MTMLTVDDLARDLKVKNEDLLRELAIMGFEVEGPESPLETDDPAALRAQLVSMLPQREVVEKRIKPTVIRRRMKPNAQPYSDKEEAAGMAAGAPEDLSYMAGPVSHEAEALEATREPFKKPAKKVKKPEAARIIEMAPPKPEPAVSAQSESAPDSESSARPERAEEPFSESERLETAGPEIPESRVASLEDTPSLGQVESKSVAQVPEDSQEPSLDRQGVIGEKQPREGRETAGPIPLSSDDRRAADDRGAKKKKKKEKRMQPAQIIGKVELRKEPAREPERVFERPDRQERTAPERFERPARPERPEGGDRPDRPAADRYERRERHEPPRIIAPAPGPRRVEPHEVVPVPLPETAEDRKKKQKARKVKDVQEERIEEEKGKVRRRREVVLRADLYDERSRYGRRSKGKKVKRKTEITTPRASKRRVKLPDLVTVSNLAHKMSVKSSEVIQHLLTLGVTATVNEGVDFETAGIVASEFGFEAEPAEQQEVDLMPAIIKDTHENLVSRSPVITVMGHVDHGKTSLLDAIRSTHVTDQEAGGITQHIGAYKVKVDKGELVFLDTPGHEAFTAMRARGAQVTDFVVLVVAADDGVMDQTVEAINHARAANVPIIVAVNKIDKPEADKDRVMRELSERDLIPESWGGDTLFNFVSAKTGAGIVDFLDTILLQAELMELKANPNKKASGNVIEARLDKGKGAVATVLVKEGTLRLGDAFVAGVHSGKVRAMLDHEGRSVEEAGPATPVEVHGFTGVPEAGELFSVVEEEKIARQIVTHRVHKQREHDLAATGPMSLEDLMARMQLQESKELNIIIKADVQGSAEALKEALLGITSQEIKVRIIHGGVGAITESDVMLASASHAIIIGFNVRPTPKTSQLAEQEKVDIRVYNVIYEAIEEVRKAMEGMLAPIEKETVQGRCEVIQTFHVPKVGTVAGCRVVYGKIERSNQVRLLRDSVVIYTGKISSMKRFKDDIKEAVQGYECGLALDNYKDVKLGDVIEAFTIERESAKLS
ncbi:MAG TPA: translation initiation factor IF-2 [Desulfomonilaceae bacterium]|nr:translation initiation factor IF-2 [Desulfomonilaceae bacterium]